MKGVLGCVLILLANAASDAKGNTGVLLREPTKPARDEGQGRKRPKVYNLPLHHLAERVPTEKKLPRDFSWANVNGRNWLTPSWNQHIPKYCGGCYMHSTLSAINDRLNIAKKGMGNVVMLSRQTFANCGPPRNYGGGCNGGGVHEVLGYLFDYGLPDDTCQIWRAENGVCDDLGTCSNCFPAANGTSNCWPVKPFTTYHVKGYNLIDVKDPSERASAIMSEIYRRGPVTCGLYTSETMDFNYYGGVWTTEGEEFDHDIEVVGWGTENGIDYWHIRNSWGTYWGEQGFIRIKRGLEKGLVEYDCWFGLPDYSEEDELYPTGKLAGSMVGLIDRTKMIVNLEEEKPLVEPQPPVSVQIDADVTSLTVESASLLRPSIWFLMLPVIAGVGLFAARAMLKSGDSSYDPIV